MNCRFLKASFVQLKILSHENITQNTIPILWLLTSSSLAHSKKKGQVI